MKIGGVEPTKCEELLVLPRKGPNIVFLAEAVDSMEDFENLCPKPDPPSKHTKEGKKPDIDAKSFIDSLTVWAEKRHAFIVVRSLRPSNIEWDTVEDLNPSTWVNWSEDLKNGGLCDVEINRVQQVVVDANALNEAKLEKARADFLRGQEKQE